MADTDYYQEQEDSPPKQSKEITDDLICPITLDLPFDPVIAEDGRVYEHAAIKKYFKGKSDALLKSPYTNVNMGKRLIPAVQLKNHIQALIDTNVIVGNVADNWNKRVHQKQEFERLRKIAENGDTMAMVKLGLKYRMGISGIIQDDELGFYWYKKAHDSGCIRGTAAVGYCFLEGNGVAQSLTQGVKYLTLAADNGSDFAAYVLGLAMANGCYGLSVNKVDAIHWLKSALQVDCKIKDMNDPTKEQCKKKLRELEQEHHESECKYLQ